MKYKAILWDADGVVLKHSRLFSEQLEIDYGIKTEILQPFFTGVFRQCSVGKADLKDELTKVIADWGWKGTVQELMDYWFTKGTQIDDEVVAYIQFIRESGVRCFMTTDQERYRGKHLQNILGNNRPFERVFFSGEIGLLKKDPAYFEYVYNTINEASLGVPTELITKDRVLFIDDSEKNIETAKGFGFNTILYTSLLELKQRLNKE